MGLLTKMTWPESTLLQVLEDAEQDKADTFDIVCLELNDGRTLTVAVICGDGADDANNMLSELQEAVR
ncbi:hypothetical protein [Pseudomonas aeruginosa]|uniref:hypothetical protein n=1 Tax=Pseudomonas aeruginosa TaxID=287 RepID=UPI000FC42503|nr:hypothetical protein [Pseudomonas aeruginosa]RUI65880.1 hypothetical protein IPC411_28125 [Pseudomonas aeruginosa]